MPTKQKLAPLTPALQGHLQIEWMTPGLQSVQAKPDVLDQPVLKRDSPSDAWGAYTYGSVHRDGGRLRMWYQARPKNVGDTSADSSFVGIAESDNGIDWRKPLAGTRPLPDGGDSSLTDLSFHCPSVVIDPDAPTSQRYRAFGFYNPPADQTPRLGGWGYFTSTSADGLRWRLDGDQHLFAGNDVITSTWDPAARGVRIAFKRNAVYRGLYRRNVYTSLWRDGQVTPPICALTPDDTDDALASQHGFAFGDYYGLTILPNEAPGVSFGVAWHFRSKPPLTNGPYRTGMHGRCDLVLVYQLEENGRWRFMPGRPDFLCAESLPEWGRGGVYGAANSIDIDGRTCFYFGASDKPHGWGVESQPSERAQLCTGLATWEAGRLAGFEAAQPQAMQLIAEPGPHPTALRLNAKCKAGGNIRAELINRHDNTVVPGFALEDCVPVEGDQHDTAVRWKSDTGRLKNSPEFLLGARLHISDATLFGYSLTVSHDSGPDGFHPPRMTPPL